jgi:hypothetical protein
MKNNKVYLVTSGNYSDYGVDAVFESEELANKFIRSLKKCYEEFRVEEYDLNPHEKQVRSGFFPFFVRMNKTGVCIEVYEESSYYGFGGDRAYNFDVNKNLYNHVFAKDEKHAIKITNEKRTELIALNKWGY